MRALLLLADGFEEIEAVTSLDLLRRAGAIVDLVSLGNEFVIGAHKLVIKADLVISDVDSSLYNALICPGGMPGSNNLMENDQVIALVQHLYENKALIAAICAAPRVLAKAGILSDKTVTCYPGTEEFFDESVCYSAENICIDGQVVTANGAGSAMEFGLTLVSLLVGADTSEKIRKDMLVNY